VKAKLSEITGGKGIEQTLTEVVRDFPYPFPSVPPAGIGFWLGNLPFSQILEADGACETFISEGRWPDLSSVIGEQIRVRLEGVLALCRIDALNAIQEMAFSDALRTLLVDFWHRKGIEWAEAVFNKQG
jgi:hypothetical protein